MPAVAKKAAKSAATKQNDVTKKPKKQSLKKVQKTADIKAAKKLAKLKATKAVSDKLNRAPVVKKQKSKHQFDPTRLNRGVILIQNLPKGFFEEQLKKYFTQYGRVTRLRLARSERTGGSKGYAFVEFKYPEVAKVAAESMNGYLMFRQRLKTLYIPPEDQDHDYFKQPVQFVKLKNGKTKLITPTTLQAAKAVKEYNKPVSAEAQANRVERSKYKLKSLEKKLAAAGINIDLSGQLYTSQPDNTVTDKQKNKPETKKINKKDTKSKSDKKTKNDTDGNTTLENLLENTIATSDEDEDDDYEPTAEELAEADQFVSSLLNEESTDENDTTLNRFLNDTIDSDESDDDDYEPTPEEIQQAKIAAQKAAKKLSNIDSTEFVTKKKGKATNKAQKKQKTVNDNDTTLNRLLNNTIDSDDSEGDDYEPTPEEIKKAKAATQKGAKQVLKVQSQKPKKGKNLVEPVKVDKVQKKRKPEVVEPPKSTQREMPAKKKKKIVESNEPVTPKPQKIRTNFVTAPTPEAPVQKKNNKNKPAKIAAPQVSPENANKNKKNADVKAAKKQAQSKKGASSPKNASPNKGKPFKKAFNKKK